VCSSTGLGFQSLGLGFQSLGLGFQSLGLGFQSLGLGFQSLGLGFHPLGPVATFLNKSWFKSRPQTSNRQHIVFLGGVLAFPGVCTPFPAVSVSGRATGLRGVQSLGLGFQSLGLGFQSLGLGFQSLGLGFQSLGLGSLQIKHWIWIWIWIWICSSPGFDRNQIQGWSDQIQIALCLDLIASALGAARSTGQPVDRPATRRGEISSYPVDRLQPVDRFPVNRSPVDRIPGTSAVKHCCLKNETTVPSVLLHPLRIQLMAKVNAEFRQISQYGIPAN
jgi:hypothetical protein